jgi:DNA-binding NtrC family response regulator
MVVDDLGAMRRIVSNCLRKLGFENIIEAESTEQALVHLEQGECSFIISDWDIPSNQQHELLSATRAHEHLKHIPILLVTPEAQRSKAEAAVRDESCSCIAKPFTADLLRNKMEHLLSRCDK